MSRKGISASLRFQVFARDNFTCAYCGAQAGQEGVSLAADHVISVADGGDNSMDNLVTACQRCNGGKGAKSLANRPSDERSVQIAKERAERLRQLAEAARESAEAMADLKQQVVNIKCVVWDVDEVHMAKGEDTKGAMLIKEFGYDLVFSWYAAAYRADTGMWEAIRYVCGCARKVRSEAADGGAA